MGFAIYQNNFIRRVRRDFIGKVNSQRSVFRSFHSRLQGMYSTVLSQDGVCFQRRAIHSKNKYTARRTTFKNPRK